MSCFGENYFFIIITIALNVKRVSAVSGIHHLFSFSVQLSLIWHQFVSKYINDQTLAAVASNFATITIIGHAGLNFKAQPFHEF